jgi:hypothetical protein
MHGGDGFWEGPSRATGADIGVLHPFDALRRRKGCSVAEGDGYWDDNFK